MLGRCGIGCLGGSKSRPARSNSDPSRPAPPGSFPILKLADRSRWGRSTTFRCSPSSSQHRAGVLQRDAKLSCPAGRERELIVADLLQRTARIAARSTVGSAERQAAERVANDLRRGRLPIIQFHTRMRNGPTAGIIRFQERTPGNGFSASPSRKTSRQRARMTRFWTA